MRRAAIGGGRERRAGGMERMDKMNRMDWMDKVVSRSVTT